MHHPQEYPSPLRSMIRQLDIYLVFNGYYLVRVFFYLANWRMIWSIVTRLISNSIKLWEQNMTFDYHIVLLFYFDLGRQTVLGIKFH